MGSRYPPGFYDDETLKAIEGTFHEVCEALSRTEPSFGCDNDGLRVAVVQQLLKLVEQGVTSPEELRTLTVGHFTAQPSV